VRRDDLPVGQQLAGVLEEQDAVAQQAPALLRVVATVKAASRSAHSAVGHCGWCLHMMDGVFRSEKWVARPVTLPAWFISVPRFVVAAEPSVALLTAFRRYFAHAVLNGGGRVTRPDGCGHRTYVVRLPRTVYMLVPPHRGGRGGTVKGDGHVRSGRFRRPTRRAVTAPAAC